MKDLPTGWIWITCPLCKGTDHQLVFETTNSLFGSTQKACLRKCSCGLYLTNPQPTPAIMHRFYDDANYYTHARPDAGWKPRLKEKLQRWQLSGPLAAIRHIVERNSDLSRYTSRFSPKHFALRPGLSFLDFGCGSGHIGAILRDIGIRFVGVEPDANARAAASENALLVYSGLIELNLRSPVNTFDRIMLRHVLEHVPDPVATLTELAPYLAKNGRLMVAVPNVDAHQAAVFGEYWIGYDMPRHRWHFSLKTLTKAAALAGFQTVSIETIELLGFARSSQKNLPPQRSKNSESKTWSARVVERQNQGSEIVAILEKGK